MANLSDIKAWIEHRLPELMAEYQVPGAAVGVCVGDEVIDHAAGVLSKATSVEATADSVFQLGSITKLWTSSLVMQLVDEGRVDIDATVRDYLPEFALADESAAAVITLRQLLCHTAGFEGDIFTDTGKGDDCLEKYLPVLAEVPQLFPPGDRFSYSNAGFCVLGRIVEVLRGKPFDDCLREFLFTPLRLTHAANGPYEAILYRAAVGHLRPEPDAEPEPAPMWSLVRSNAPAGSTLTMRPRDLLVFARMQMRSGAAPDGTPVLSPSSVRAMRERQVDLPNTRLRADAWGLGWIIFDDTPGATIIGHNGGTIGQSAFLRVVPERDVAVALLTNGGDSVRLCHDVVGHVVAELAGVELPPLPVPPVDPPRIDGRRYAGTYSSRLSDLTVTQDEDGRIWLTVTPKGLSAELGQQVERWELVAFEHDTLITAQPERGVHTPYAFLGDDGTGRARYLHTSRANRRVDS
ncbi:MAG TPA: serine hydrolase domain-containing protein [Pseudonocardiaceae bacterium]|jgi:CubicO group peptidase (beta-lactamase class C family)